MAEDPIEVIRLAGEGSSVVLRITGKHEPAGASEAEALVLFGEFVVETPFVSGTLATRLSPQDLRQWQESLDALDAGQDIAWCEGKPVPWLFIDRDHGDDRYHVTVKDHAASPTAVTVTVPLTDAWFDDAYHRLDHLWDTLALTPA